MRLILARHGETKENIKDISQGQLHGRLTKKGKIQANKLAKRLARKEIDIIYCSDLKRCKHTLAPLLKIRKIPIIYSKELRERNSGIFQGRPSKELHEWFEKQILKYPNKSKYKIRLPRGESFIDMKKRVVKFFEKIIKKEKNKNVLIVSHGGAIISLGMYLFKKKSKTFYKKFRHDHAAISVIEINENGRHKIKLLNSAKHLQ